MDQETLNRIDYQNQVQTLIEEIDFLRRAHDSEIQDLQAMASRDTTSENREFFRNELASAIRDIREEYDKVGEKFMIMITFDFSFIARSATYSASTWSPGIS